MADLIAAALLPTFEIADIILIRGQGWLADNICKATKSRVSHVGLVIGINPVIVLEALWRVKTNPLIVTIKDCQAAWRGRVPNLTYDQKLAVVNRALRFSAEDYGSLDLLLQLADSAFHTRWFTNRIGRLFLEKYPICSFVVASAFSPITPFGVGNWSVAPHDIDVWLQTTEGSTTPIPLTA